MKIMIWIIVSMELLLTSVCGAAEVTLELEKFPEYTDDNIYLSQKNKLKATASFVSGQTASGVKIELLPSVTTTIFALGDILDVRVGNALSTANTVGKDDIQKYKGIDQTTPNAKIEYMTRAVLDFGSVTCGAASGTDTQIVIEYEVVFVDIGDKSEGAEFWTSAGMEYDDYIWISQISYTLRNSTGATVASPTFSIDTGIDEEITIGIPKSVTLSMNLPYSKQALLLETLVINQTTKDTILVQSMNLSAVGNAYAYSLKQENVFSIGYDKCPLSRRMTLDLGSPVNKESADINPNNEFLLEVQMVYQVFDRALIGDTYMIGVGLDVGGTELWVGDFSLTVTDPEVLALDSFTLAAKSEMQSAAPGFAVGASINFTVPERSNLNYSFSLTASGMSILSMNPETYGVNIPCEIHPANLDLELVETSPGVDGQAFMAVNLSNTGMYSTGNISDANLVTFGVYLMMSSGTGDRTLSVQVNDLVTQTVTFNVSANQDYPTNLNYTFELVKDCASGFHAGSILVYRMTVNTERGVTAGPMTIEAPIPANLSQPNLKFKSADIVTKGINVVSVRYGPVEANITDWVANSGENDRAVLTIPLVCNFQLKDDVGQDKFVVKIRLIIKETTPMMKNNSDELGVGVKFSGNQIWIGSSTFSTKAAIDLMKTKEITGVYIPDNEGPITWPGDLALQWSADGVSFYDYTYTWDNGTAGMGNTLYKPSPSLYARYVRLLNKAGYCNPAYTLYTTEITDEEIAFHGDANLTAKLFNSVMFMLDNNASTCMPLPTSNTSDSTSYFWVTLNTTFLGTNGTSPFNLTIIGHGITCNGSAGPQVTKVLHPSDSNTLKFEGKRKRCHFQEENAEYEPAITCTYKCACTDAVTCADVSLLLYYWDPAVQNGGSPSDRYQICDVMATA